MRGGNTAERDDRTGAAMVAVERVATTWTANSGQEKVTGNEPAGSSASVFGESGTVDQRNGRL